MTTPSSTIEVFIKDYIERKERSHLSGKRRTDLEKEYNKLLTLYGGESKHYNLEQAGSIYKAHCEMTASAEEAQSAKARFDEAEQKLMELGAILFEGTIEAEIAVTPANGEAVKMKMVRVAYYNGQVIVS
jgi:hypothetical protein